MSHPNFSPLIIPQGDFEAYIFDCDGTLADTMPTHYKAWCIALEIALILRGDAKVLEGVVRETLETVDESSWSVEKALELCDSLMVSSRVGRGVAAHVP